MLYMVLAHIMLYYTINILSGGRGVETERDGEGWRGTERDGERQRGREAEGDSEIDERKREGGRERERERGKDAKTQ